MNKYFGMPCAIRWVKYHVLILHRIILQEPNEVWSSSFCRCKYLSFERLNDALKLKKLANIMADLSGCGTSAPNQLVWGRKKCIDLGGL